MAEALRAGERGERPAELPIPTRTEKEGLVRSTIRHTIAFFAALLLLAAATVPALATRGQPDKLFAFESKFTTFQTAMDFAFTAPGAERCPASAAWFSVFDGDGWGRHLGLFTEHNSHCAFVDGTTATGMFGHLTLGEDVLTAANGDMLTDAYYGEWEVDYVAGVATAVTYWTITGGTGRFEGATGSGELHLVQPLDAGGWGSGFASGEITYDASSRSAN